MQMCHQAHVEIEVRTRDLFEDRQHIPPLGGGDEEIRVFHARGDVLEVDDVADVIRRHKGAGLVQGNRGENTHGSEIPQGGLRV